MNKKIFGKSLNLANFVNFVDLPQGGRGYHPLLANPVLMYIFNMFVDIKFCFEITITIIDRTLEWLFITVFVINV